jgi:hypothetical protein
MISAMNDVATAENVRELIRETQGVGKEVCKHILEFLSDSNLSKQYSTEMLALNVSSLKRKVSCCCFIFRQLQFPLKIPTLQPLLLQRRRSLGSPEAMFTLTLLLI